MPASPRPKLDIPFQTDEEILDLVTQFEACRWPYERWTHRAHLAVAALYLAQYPFADALARIRQNIQAYNRACGDPNGYHETITVVFLRLIHNFLATNPEPRSLTATVAELFARFDTKTPLAYFSPERLSSPIAKQRWIEPNLKPLPLSNNIMDKEILLFYPEWQSYGEDTRVHNGALKVVRRFFNPDDFIHVDVPEVEELERVNGVLGLHSIAPRFRSTIQRLRLEAPSKIFMVGGTCGVEVAPIAYLNERYHGSLAVVWLDAHGDLNTPQSSPSGHFHGMALRTLLGEGPLEYTTELNLPLRPSQLFLVGTRDLDVPEVEFIERHEVSVTKPSGFDAPDTLIQQVRSRSLANLYIHLDLDVLNPESFPNSLMQTPGGPSIVQVQQMIKALSVKFNAVGFSIVEYCEHTCGIPDSLGELIFESGITLSCCGRMMPAQD
jgi:arginase